MAYKRSDAADVRIFLVERDTEALPFPARSSDFVVLNKSDLGVKDGLSVSGKTGEGVSELLDLIAESLLKKTSLDVVAIRERQVKGLNAANTLLLNVIALTEQKPLPFELASQELYFALTELDFVFGKIDIENVLDEIFSSFCLGK
jgi:tRNA modification GTPase